MERDALRLARQGQQAEHREEILRKRPLVLEMRERALVKNKKQLEERRLEKRALDEQSKELRRQATEQRKQEWERNRCKYNTTQRQMQQQDLDSTVERLRTRHDEFQQYRVNHSPQQQAAELERQQILAKAQSQKELVTRAKMQQLERLSYRQQRYKQQREQEVSRIKEIYQQKTPAPRPSEALIFQRFE